MTLNKFLEKFNKWALRGSVSIIDQSLHAGTHFIVSIFLARNIASDIYGQFAFIFSIYVFFQMSYRAFWYSPMLYYGTVEFNNNLSEYTKKLKIGHFAATFLIMLTLLIFRSFIDYFDSFVSIRLIISISFAFSGMLLLLMVRRSFYIILRPEKSMLASLLYFVFSTIGIVTCQVNDTLNLELIFAILGIASILSSLILTINNKLFSVYSKSHIRSKSIIYKHFEYGKWLFMAAIFTWISTEIYYSLLVYYNQFEDGAVLKAIMSILKPVLHINLGLSALLIPIFASKRNAKENQSSLKISIVAMLSLALFYWLFILIFSDEVMKIVYGNESVYIQYSEELIVLSIIPVFHSFTTVYGGWLQSQNLTKLLAFVYALGALVSVVCSLVYVPYNGLEGSIKALIASNFVISAGLVIFTYIKSFRAI